MTAGEWSLFVFFLSPPFFLGAQTFFSPSLLNSDGVPPKMKGEGQVCNESYFWTPSLLNRERNEFFFFLNEGGGFEEGGGGVRVGCQMMISSF